MAKNLPAMQETRVQSLGGEDPLEKEMATHSSILAWTIPWTKESHSYSPWGHKEVRHNSVTELSLRCLYKLMRSLFINVSIF